MPFPKDAAEALQQIRDALRFNPIANGDRAAGILTAMETELGSDQALELTSLVLVRMDEVASLWQQEIRKVQ